MNKETENFNLNTTTMRLQMLSAMSNRISMMAGLGKDTYNGNRDIYSALGYPKVISFQMYLDRYNRQGIAKSIINTPVRATWAGDIKFMENVQETSIEERDTNKLQVLELNKSWKLLEKKHKIIKYLARLDRLAGIGEFATLLIGYDDCNTVEAFATPVKEKQYKKDEKRVRFFKVIRQDMITISEYDVNIASIRYGSPLIYDVCIESEDGRMQQQNIKVHHTRLLHAPSDNDSSDMFGEPRLKDVYNYLLNIEKVAGGDGEMFWRGARPGYTSIVRPEYTMTPEAENNLKTQLDEYEMYLRRFLSAEGVDIKELKTQVSDPTPHVLTQLRLISMTKGIPLRILIGTETGEQAGTTDVTNWREHINDRRSLYVEPCILFPFLAMGQEYGFLPKTSPTLEVQWKELHAPSTKEKVGIGNVRADAIGKYTKDVTAMQMIPMNSFLKKILYLSDGDIADIEMDRKHRPPEEQLLIDKIIEKQESKDVEAPKKVDKYSLTKTVKREQDPGKKDIDKNKNSPQGEE